MIPYCNPCEWCQAQIDGYSANTHVILVSGDYICLECFEAEIDKEIARWRTKYGETDSPQEVYRYCRDLVIQNAATEGSLT